MSIFVFGLHTGCNKSISVLNPHATWNDWQSRACKFRESQAPLVCAKVRNFA